MQRPHSWEQHLSLFPATFKARELNAAWQKLDDIELKLALAWPLCIMHTGRRYYSGLKRDRAEQRTHIAWLMQA